jgi:hypothetical protein
MEDPQAQRVNEAAKKFAASLTEAYRAVAGRSVSAQELNAQLTQEFFNGVINNLRTQAENNQALAEDLIEQQRKQQEASQRLTQESVNAYMDFLNSVFAFPREGAQTAGRARREAGEAPLRPGPEVPPGGEVRPDTTPGDVRRGTTPDAPITPPDESVPPDVASSPGLEERPAREEPPPGEERPERRGAARTTPPTPREEPPAGEERPGRRTP